jgi:hypothetical protein
LGDKIKKNDMGGKCSAYGGEERRIQGFGRPRRRWEDNIKMDLQGIGCGSKGWIELAQNKDRWRRLVIAVMNILFP